jgi:magnesium chelatase subunit D
MSSVEMAALKLKNLRTGGSTPLARGVLKALDVLAAEQRRDPDVVQWLVLITDGRAV